MTATLTAHAATQAGRGGQAPALELPDYLTDTPVAAHIETRQRTITWTLEEPGELHRNRYARAWIDVVERDAFRPHGEVWLRAYRRATAGGYERLAWTDTGRRLLAADILPAVQRYGFARLWGQLHRAAASPADAIARKKETEALVGWWDLKAIFTSLYASGGLEVRATGTDRLKTERVADNYIRTNGYARADVFAALWHKGRQIGWMTTGGDIIPDGHILELSA